MLFGWAIGSEGTRDVSYTVRLPLTLSPGSNLPDGKALSVAGHDATIRKEDFVHVLEVRGFASETAAHDFLCRLYPACAWLGLTCRIGLMFPGVPGEIHYFEEPQAVSEKSDLFPLTSKKGWSAVDGDYYHDRAVVVPEHKRLMRWMMGRPHVSIGPPADRAASGLNEAIELPNIKGVFEDAKLSLALELYSTSFFERSTNAQFLTLITALEALMPKSHQRRSGVRRLQSSGKRIATYVASLLHDEGAVPDAEGLVSEVTGLYRLRNKLVHEGAADPGSIQEAKTRLLDVVRRVLLTLFLQVARADSNASGP